MTNLEKNFLLDESKFKKTSKKLQAKLNDLVDKQHEFKLTEVQEILSSSLGFRNYFDLQNQLFNTSIAKISNEKKANKTIFNKINISQAIQIFSLLINNKTPTFFETRAISLISCALNIVYFLKNENNEDINISIVEEFLNLDKLISVYKNHEKNPEHINLMIKNYLNFLPEFNPALIIQKEVTREQHAYVQMQLSLPLQIINEIEKNDILIGDCSWFIFEDSSGNTKFEINNNLKTIELENSWLFDERYIDYIKKMHQAKKLNKIYVSDLFAYIATILSKQKQNFLFDFLNELLSNYNMASEYSNLICQNQN